MRSLEDIKGACVIDEETGCWVWKLGFSGSSPYCHWGPDYGRGKQPSVPAYRAAWLASGREIRPGHQVWRTCGNIACVNPDHLDSGTAKKRYAFIKSSGMFRGQANRIVANQRSRESQLTPLSTVRQIEAMLDAGHMLKDIKAETGSCSGVIRRVARGIHIHSRSAITSAPNSSIFALGRALQGSGQ